jgi:hypothetical protein
VTIPGSSARRRIPPIEKPVERVREHEGSHRVDVVGDRRDVVPDVAPAQHAEPVAKSTVFGTETRSRPPGASTRWNSRRTSQGFDVLEALAADDRVGRAGLDGQPVVQVRPGHGTAVPPSQREVSMS